MENIPNIVIIHNRNRTIHKDNIKYKKIYI